jgi:predicted GH43/DUF377 family glycosyl hydrolase
VSVLKFRLYPFRTFAFLSVTLFTIQSLAADPDSDDHSPPAIIVDKTHVSIAVRNRIALKKLNDAAKAKTFEPLKVNPADEWSPSNQSANRWNESPEVPTLEPDYPVWFKSPLIKNKKPIFGPNDKYSAIYNPAELKVRSGPNREYKIVLRAEITTSDPDHPRESLPVIAKSKDGKTGWVVEDHPAFKPEAWFNKGGGIEDPRYADYRRQPYVAPNGKTYDGAIHYTGFDKTNARIGTALFNHEKMDEFYQLPEPLFKDEDVLKNPAVPGRPWNKSPAVIQYEDPITHQNRNLIFAGEGNLNHGGIYSMMADSPLDWKWSGNAPVITAREGKYDQNLVECAFAPVIRRLPPKLAEQEGMSHGIYLFVHGDSPPKGYQMGYHIFSLRDPTGKPIYSSEAPMAGPELPWEKAGQVDLVTFYSGGILDDEKNELLLPYGAADEYVGFARAKIEPNEKVRVWQPGTPDPKLLVSKPQCIQSILSIFK